MSQGSNFYSVLGVARNATPAEIKQAYRKKSAEHHPDRAGPQSHVAMAAINEAYRVLSDEELRAKYDAMALPITAMLKEAAAEQIDSAIGVASEVASAHLRSAVPSSWGKVTEALDGVIRAGAQELRIRARRVVH